MQLVYANFERERERERERDIHQTVLIHTLWIMDYLDLYIIINELSSSLSSALENKLLLAKWIFELSESKLPMDTVNTRSALVTLYS